MIIITFIRRFAGLGCGFALILILALLKGAFYTPSYMNEMLYLEEQTDYADAFDSTSRKVKNVNDQYGNRFVEALVYESEGTDRYQLRGEYVIFTGTVFVPENHYQTERASQVLIYGDGKLLWTTSSPMRAGSPNEDFAIDVRGVEVLDIRHIGYGSTIGIGNFSLSREMGNKGFSPVPGYTRLLDIPCDSTFRYRFADTLQRDEYGNEYQNSILYQWGRECDYDAFSLNGQFATLSGTVFIPDDRTAYPHFGEEDGYVKIHGDGVLLWISPKMDNSNPVEFSIDVTGVMTLTISWVAGSEFNHVEIAMGNLILR